MAITKDQFKNAFRTAISLDYVDIPENDDIINVSFSDEFIKKMQKLIISQKKSYWYFINTTAKKVAAVFLVSMILFSSMMSVRAIREPVVEFFKEVYDTFVSYFFEGDTIDEISKTNSNETTSSINLPSGFVQIDVLENKNMISTIYANEHGDTIEFVSAITDEAKITFDTEHMQHHTIYITDVKVDVYEGDGIKHAIWIEDSTLKLITCCGNIQMESIEAMILSSIND